MREETAVTAESNKALVRRYFEVTARRDVAAVDQLLTQDFVTHNPVRGTPPDREGVKQAAMLRGSVFPDERTSIEELVAEDDRVVVRWSWRGTHTGELLGIPPSGRQVTMNGLSMYRISDGHIAEEWEERDTLGLLQQLGAAPAIG
jgi:steroid delta-isomerase-like uncharacterized protein